MSEFEHGRPDGREPRLPEELLRALRAPGTPEELAGEADVLAAFRAARRAPATRLRLVGRLGAGGAAAVATLVLGSGVAAAAYTNSLPDPVQRLAHRVLAPIGVPAAAPRPHPTGPTRTTPPPTPSSPSSAQATTSSASSATSALSGRPSRTPSAKPAGSSTLPAPTSLPTSSAAPTTSASVTPTPSPATTPSSRPRPLPTSVSLTVSSASVAAGSSVWATGGVVDASGTPVARQRVLFQENTGNGWTTVTVAVTDHLGSVSLPSPALTQNTRFRLKVTNPALTKPLLSTPQRVTETPALVVTFTSGALRISALGARQGDTLRIGLVQNGVITQIGTAILTGTGAIYPVDQTTTRQRFIVVLPRSPQHLGAKGAVSVPPAGR